jgi:hypothetical protein
MSVDQFTIVLTKGTHLISRSSAELVIRAIDDDRRTVEIELDPFGDFDPDRRTVVAVRHVVAVTENQAPIASDSTALALARRRRDRRSL